MTEEREVPSPPVRAGGPEREPHAAAAADPDHPYAGERPFWVGVAMVLSLSVAGLVLAFFAVRVALPALLGR